MIEKINPSHPDKDFNSIMVQLKLQDIDFFSKSHLDFNSIMVQLKQSVEYPHKYNNTFQFHNGTIKTVYCGKDGFIAN